MQILNPGINEASTAFGAVVAAALVLFSIAAAKYLTFALME